MGGRGEAWAGLEELSAVSGGAGLPLPLFRCLNWGSQVLFIGFASGTIPKVAANIALVKNLTLHGVYWGMYLKHRPQVRIPRQRQSSHLQGARSWIACPTQQIQQDS